jgi:thiol-disulfide isomerase/thioredoxin
MHRIARALLPLVALAVAFAPAAAGVVLDPHPAPDWKVTEWINGDPGPLTGHSGKVVVIHFFQMWCPACNEFSIPLMKRWEEKYGGGEVLLVSIHTVFEGHDQQTPERLRDFVRRKGLTHPVGIDAPGGPEAVFPETMQRFGTGGTPHLAVIDKQGRLAFSYFGVFRPDAVEAFIERLASE